MTDLVEKVAQRLMSIFQPDGEHVFTEASRAAIAAVLDDLSEPTKAMLDAADPEPWLGIPYEPDSPEEVWKAMLTQKRKEIGL